MACQRLGAFWTLGVKRAQEVQLRHLGIDYDHSFSRQPHNQIRYPVAALGLFDKVAMRAHSRGFDYSPQSLLTPSSSRLIGLEHDPKLLGLLSEHLAILSKALELLLHFAKS